MPFLLRTGKCMAESHQRVSIRFKKPVETMPELPCDCNTLSFELSGDGEIALSLVTKQPGPTVALASGSAILPLGTAFGSSGLPAYARLIHDVLLGDRSLFTRPDGLHHVWEVAATLLERKPDPLIYTRGSWPREARGLASRERLDPRRVALARRGESVISNLLPETVSITQQRRVAVSLD